MVSFCAWANASHHRLLHIEVHEAKAAVDRAYGQHGMIGPEPRYLFQGNGADHLFGVRMAFATEQIDLASAAALLNL